ncbi:MAG: polysaccharide deacetylase family protein [Burkholderiales bacterium]
MQGKVAEKFPRMVEQIVAEKHEVQSHGYSHRSLLGMSPATLRAELQRARASVEDASGLPITAFRAPDFSIGLENLWALEYLAEAGFTVDSSIFPIRTRRYGIATWQLAPQAVPLSGGRTILEIPVAVWSVAGRRIPVGGGGYFRLWPGSLLQRAFQSILSEGRPVVIYCHPYEFNKRELNDYRAQVPYRTRLTQGLGRPSFVRRVRRLLAQLRLGRLDEVVRAWNLG